MPALQDAIDDAFNAKIGDVSGRGKLGIDMREIWTMQPRFEKRTGSAPYSMLEQPRFRAGFDFLRLRGQTGEIDKSLADWWEKFSTAYDDERHEMIEQARLELQAKPQAPRVRVRRKDDAAPGTEAAAADRSQETADDTEPVMDGEGSGAPRKRRRRRKSTGRGDAAAPDSASGAGSAD
jgi:poly(A) polymerase